MLCCWKPLLCGWAGPTCGFAWVCVGAGEQQPCGFEEDRLPGSCVVNVLKFNSDCDARQRSAAVWSPHCAEYGREWRRACVRLMAKRLSQARGLEREREILEAQVVGSQTHGECAEGTLRCAGFGIAEFSRSGALDLSLSL